MSSPAESPFSDYVYPPPPPPEEVQPESPPAPPPSSLAPPVPPPAPGLSTGTLVGLIAGGVIGVILLVLAVVCSFVVPGLSLVGRIAGGVIGVILLVVAAVCSFVVPGLSTRTLVGLIAGGVIGEILLVLAVVCSYVGAGLYRETFVGLIAGGVILLVLAVVCSFVVCYRGRRRSKQHRVVEESYHGEPPREPKDDHFSGPPQHLQHNYASPKPTPPPGSTPPVPSSTSSSLGSEKPPTAPTSGLAFGSQSTFTYEELVMATSGFSNANLLGQGGFGFVHKGILPNGKVVAIKQLKVGSGQGEREFQAEVELISRVHHRHLVSLVGYCISGARRLLVYEFVANDTLEFHLHGKGRPTMDWSTRMKIAVGSAKGLAYLHEDCQPKIIHRDIKAANILIDDKFEAKVADFGLAKIALDTDTHVSTRVMGTFGYMAPEYASSGKLTEKSDVFSFGVVLLELITGHRPIDKTHSFTDDSTVEWARPLLTQALENGKFDGLVDARMQNDYNSSEMACMIACAAACVRYSARRRPRMSQVVRALEGNISLEGLNEGIIPGHSMVFSSYGGSTEYNSREYREDLKKFRKVALESQEQEQGTSEISGPSSEFGLHQSASSGEGQQTTEEIEHGKVKKDT